MAGSMKELPASTVRHITSTQVITSVVSVVKELLENSLDAGATRIDIKLENYGFDRIEVRDNGSGISPADASYMARPHYTSKLGNLTDLESLATYGFRGEALGSLSAVADVVVTTKTANVEVGTTYTIDHKGDVTGTKPSHLTQGTTVAASNLFKNLPVRKQFYSTAKKRKEELKKVEDLVTAFSIICHKVGFTLKHNKLTVWQSNPVASPRDVLVRVFGSPVMATMNHMTRKDDFGIELRSWLPNSKANVGQCSRATGDRLYTFINQRPVIDKDIEKLVRQYFSSGGRCDSSRYPLACVAIVIPAQDLDVNLDPNKTKVMLHKKTEVLGVLKSVLEDVYGPLEKADTSKPDETLNKSSDTSVNSSTTMDSFTDIDTPDRNTKPSSNKQIQMITATNRNNMPEAAWKANFVSAFDKLADDPNSKSEQTYIGAAGNGPEVNEVITKVTSGGKENATDETPGGEGIKMGVTPGVEIGNDAPMPIAVDTPTHAEPLSNSGKVLSGISRIDQPSFNIVSDDDFLMTSTPLCSNDQNMHGKIISGECTFNQGTPGSVNSKGINNNNKIDSSDSLKCSDDHHEDISDDVLLQMKIPLIEQGNKPASGSEKEMGQVKYAGAIDTVGVAIGGGGISSVEGGVATGEGGAAKPKVGGESAVQDWSRGIAVKDGQSSVQPVTLLSGGQCNPPPPVLNKSLMEVLSENQNNTSKLKLNKTSEASSSSTVKRPSSAYIHFSKAVRPQVVLENPGLTFDEIGRRVAQQWKAVPAEDKEEYEQLAAADNARYRKQIENLKPTGAPKPVNKKRKLEDSSSKSSLSSPPGSSEPRLPARRVCKAHFCMKRLKDLHEQSFRASQREKSSTPSMQLVGALKSHGVWFGIEGEQIWCIHPSRAQEMLIYQHLLEDHALPLTKLQQTIRLHPGNVGGADNWQTLLGLDVASNTPGAPTVCTDPRIVNNGFTVTKLQGQDDVRVELTCMSDVINTYGLRDLQDILTVITQDSLVTLSRCRPTKVRFYLQAEAVRMSRRLPPRVTGQEVKDILGQVTSQLDPGVSTCFHKRPFLFEIYNLNQIQQSQDG